jgi:hypothetical protein
VEQSDEGAQHTEIASERELLEKRDTVREREAVANQKLRSARGGTSSGNMGSVAGRTFKQSRPIYSWRVSVRGTTRRLIAKREALSGGGDT